MTMKITRKEDILENQETSIAITTNTTLWLESLINHKNRRLGLHNYDRIILKERITNVHVKKDDNNGIKLWDYKKENVSHYIRDQTVKKIF